MTTEAPLMESITRQVPKSTPRPASSPRLMLSWLLPGLGTGALLWMCYFPLAWGCLAWVALVPLLSLVRLDVSRGRVFWGAYVAGSAFFWPALQWMRVADYRMYATWAMLAIYCSFYFAVGVWLIRVLDRRTRLPLVLSVALVWTGLEFVRSFLMTGFAWYFLGHSQHAYLPMIQIADVTGVYGISFLIAAVNAWVFELAYRSEAVRRILGPLRERPVENLRSLGIQGAGLLILILGCLGYGSWRLEQEVFLPGPRLALLQGNLDQRIRNSATEGGVRSMKTIFDYYTALCERACHTYPQPDLLVWPETSFPYQWVEFPERLDNISRTERDYGEMLYSLLNQMSQKRKTAHLLGLNSMVLDDQGKGKQYNSALLYPPNGYRGDRYDKVHRVPFGEYVPLRDWLPFMNWFAPYDFDYSIRAGEKLTRFPLGKNHRFGVLICYEDTDPFLARAYGVTDQDGPPVDFLINISNDGWFDGTSEHEQHLALCRFRAIECRRAVARAVNMGISAVIDSNGRVQKPERMPQFQDCHFWVVQEKRGRIPELPESEWHAYKKVDGVLTATIPIDSRSSIYVRCGDWLPSGCWLAILACLFVLRRRPSLAV